MSDESKADATALGKRQAAESPKGQPAAKQTRATAGGGILAENQRQVELSKKQAEDARLKQLQKQAQQQAEKRTALYLCVESANQNFLIPVLPTIKVKP